MPVDTHANVGTSERWISTLGGAALAAYGLRHLSDHTLAAAAATAAAGTLVYRGTTGHCPMYGTLGVSTARGREMDHVIEDAVTINRPAAELRERWRTFERPSGLGATLEDAAVFREAGPHGTEVRVRLPYQPLGGRVGAAVAWAFGRNRSTQLRQTLRRFKQLVEAGEVPTIEGQPRGEQKVTNYD